MIKNIGALVLGLAAACGPAAAVEPWALYDDFTSTYLDPGRWPATSQERRRTVEGNVARLMQRDLSRTDLDSGRTGYSFGNSIARGTAVKQMRSYVRVNAVDMAACSSPSANTTPARVRARLVNTYFSTGNRVTGSNVGDVIAQLYLFRDSNSADPAGTLRVEGNVLICRDSTCADASTVGGTGPMGTAVLGQNVLLTLEWDRAAKLFRFSRDNGLTWFPVSYNTAALSLDDSAEPGNMFKSIGTRTDVPNCVGGPRASAFIDAQFDLVSVNKSAAP